MTTDAVEGAAEDAGPNPRVESVIAAIRQSAASIKRREVDRAVGELDAAGDVADDQRETLEAMADAIVDQLLAAPAESLRDADDERAAVETAIRLFDPDIEEVSDDE